MTQAATLEMSRGTEAMQASPFDGIESQLPTDIAVGAALDQARAAWSEGRTHVEVNGVDDARRLAQEVRSNLHDTSGVVVAEALDAAGFVTATRADAEPFTSGLTHQSDYIKDAAADYSLAEVPGPFDSRRWSPIEDKGYGKEGAVREAGNTFEQAIRPNTQALDNEETATQVTQAGLDGLDNRAREGMQQILDAHAAGELSTAEVAQKIHNLSKEIAGPQSTVSPEVLATLERNGILTSKAGQKAALDEIVTGAPERFAEWDKREEQLETITKFMGAMLRSGTGVSPRSNAPIRHENKLNYPDAIDVPSEDVTDDVRTQATTEPIKAEVVSSVRLTAPKALEAPRPETTQIIELPDSAIHEVTDVQPEPVNERQN